MAADEDGAKMEVPEEPSPEDACPAGVRADLSSSSTGASLLYTTFSSAKWTTRLRPHTILPFMLVLAFSASFLLSNSRKQNPLKRTQIKEGLKGHDQ